MSRIDMSIGKKAFVIGWPVDHSISPILHGYWLKELGINGSYEKIPVAPEDLPNFFSDIQNSGFAGGNVTVPHKEQAFASVDRCDDIASQLNAVNTVWLEDGILMGSNTDGYGFAANLDNYAPAWRQGKKAMVLGAGGASRAIISAIKEAGYTSIHIINRNVDKAKNLVSKFGFGCHADGWDGAAAKLGDCDLLVNTTSLTMKNNEPFPLSLEGLPQHAIVTDIVYTPLETSLLRQARNGGYTCVDGLGMLLHQAVPGFEKWFGQKPMVTEGLRTHLLDYLAKETKQ